MSGNIELNRSGSVVSYKYTAEEHFSYPPGGVVSLEWIKEEISTFYLSEKWTTIIFSPLLDSNHRRVAHIQAQDLKLTSKSIGQEEERCLFVHKNIPKDEMAKRQKKEWSSIPVGVSRILETFEATFYLGSGIDARQEKNLKELQITHVLNFSSKWEEEEFSDIEYSSYYLPEKSTDDALIEMMEALEGAFAFINNVISSRSNSSYQSNSARILFHCIDGNTKSAVTLMAYLIKFQNFNLRSAYDLVKERRPQICPSTHMMRFLCHFEIEIRGGTSTMTLKDWVIPAKQKIDNTSAKHKKGISKVAKEEIAFQWLPLDKLIYCADQVCEGDYNESNMEQFIKYTLSQIQNDQLLEQEMREKSFKWSDIERTLIDRAKDWFTDRIQQNHYRHNSPQSDSEDSMDLLFS